MRLVIAHYDVVALVRKTVSEIVDDNILGLASETAWSMFFGIFPALLFAASILSLVGNQQQMFQTAFDHLAPVIPPSALGVVQGVLHDVLFTKSAPGIASIGALLALYAGSQMFSTLMRALNTAFDVRETRPWWKQQLIAIAAAAGSVVVLWIATVIFLAGQQIVGFASNQLGMGPVGAIAWTILQYPVAFALITGLFWLLYLVLPDLPDRPRPWRAALLAAVIATILWTVVTTLFRLYVQHFGSYNKTYGAIGAVIVLLTWMYWSSFALLAAGELASEIRAGSGRDAPPVRSGR